MLAFGLGTLPAVLCGAYGAGSFVAFLGRRGMRSTVAIALLLFSVATAGGPWLASHGIHAMHWLPFDCTQ